MTATTVTLPEELKQIIALQKKNLRQHITTDEKDMQGFVTMEFSLGLLEKLHLLAPSIIIKDNNRVIAYAIVVLQAGRHAYADMEPMFLNFEKLTWKNKSLNSYNFYVMGQICIDKAYRKKGLFETLYQKHKEIYCGNYDFVVTEVSTSNYRSLAAHHRVGFETIDTFRDVKDEWAVVIWDWR